MPLQRSLAIDYTLDQNIYRSDFENQYLFGPSILVAPLRSDQKALKVYFPEGKWFSIYDDSVYQGNTEELVEAPLDRLPVFAKGGSIIPLQSVIQNTSEKPEETIEIHIYHGPKNEAMLWYEDDGSTYEFENGSFSQRYIDLDSEGNKLIFSKVEGSFISRFSKIRLVMHGFGSEITSVKVNNKTIKNEKHNTYIDILNNGKTRGNPLIFTFENEQNQININW